MKNPDLYFEKMQGGFVMESLTLFLASRVSASKKKGERPNNYNLSLIISQTALTQIGESFKLSTN